MAARRQACRLYNRCGRRDGWENEGTRLAKREYGEKRRIAWEEIGRCKRRKEEQELKAVMSGGDANEAIWRHVKGLVGTGGKREQQVLECLGSGGEVLTSEKEIKSRVVEVWGKVFESAGEASLGQGRREKCLEGSLRDVIDREELDAAIRKLKRNKAEGEDQVIAEFFHGLLEGGQRKVA